ncbi:hypothetical protein [Magnetococcus sp. PR-3]|uniref:hypothetical protein n=1 Tax=Magnetococcus sp. PR-3 TaxID=3120355 RepID=UPI002FCE50C3
MPLLAMVDPHTNLPADAPTNADLRVGVCHLQVWSPGGELSRLVPQVCAALEKSGAVVQRLEPHGLDGMIIPFEALPSSHLSAFLEHVQLAGMWEWQLEDVSGVDILQGVVWVPWCGGGAWGMQSLESEGR